MEEVKLDCPMCGASFSGPTEEDARKKLMEHSKNHKK